MRIAIIYCTAGVIDDDRKLEQLAECEVIVTASGVERSLKALGHQVEVIDLCGFPLDGLRQFDFVFNLAETTVGYPFTVDQVALWLEKAHIPFTGAGSACLKDCADKARTKAILQSHGFTTPAFEVITSANPSKDGLCFPLIIKPLGEEGSIGITERSVVSNFHDLEHQVNLTLRRYKQPVLVEEYVDGKDVAVSLVGTGSVMFALPISEIIYAPAFSGLKILTYDAKWVPESAAYQQTSSLCPSTLDTNLEENISQMALAAARLLDCRDYTRVDFRLRGEIPYILEVNPNPCINPSGSGFVHSASAAGYSYDGLVQAIFESAISRQDATEVSLNKSMESI